MGFGNFSEAFAVKLRGVQRSFLLTNQPEVPGNGFGSCRSWLRVAGISKALVG